MSAAPRPGHSPRTALAGIALTVGACASFALLDTAAKLVSATTPLLLALWLQGRGRAAPRQGAP